MQAGVDIFDLDFLICNAGALLWHITEGAQQDGGAGGTEHAESGLLCDEEYERHVDFRWDPHVVKQVCMNNKE